MMLSHPNRDENWVCDSGEQERILTCASRFGHYMYTLKVMDALRVSQIAREKGEREKTRGLERFLKIVPLDNHVMIGISLTSLSLKHLSFTFICFFPVGILS